MKLVLVFLITIYSNALDFKLYQKDTDSGNTLLVIGGIHGNEPGGYFAASMLTSYYKITKGSLWVVPNLNFDSLVRYSRGIHGDMNRKFSTIKKNDKDYKAVMNIKKIILNKKIDLVLNLHDGYGFYRRKYQNAIFNPNAWGQAFIIDQHKLDIQTKFGNLNEIAQKISSTLNNRDNLVKKHHSFGLKNTKTKFLDEQMKLSLTYFAVTHNKPAFAIETSKNITDLTQKVIYQLRSIEEFMKIMGIEYQRDFDIENYQDVKSKLYNFGDININNNFIFSLNNVRGNIKYVPLKKRGNSITFTHPLGAIRVIKGEKRVYIGNKHITTLKPDYFEHIYYKNGIKIEVDGIVKTYKIGEEVHFGQYIKVLEDHMRVNIIGFNKKGVKNEANIEVKKSELLRWFSFDKKSRVYRIEFYKEDKFVGMIRARVE
jgi:hypothetical protein